MGIKYESDSTPFDVETLRKELGLKPITFKNVRCRHKEWTEHGEIACEKTFDAQFKDGRQHTFYCVSCNYSFNYMRAYQR